MHSLPSHSRPGMLSTPAARGLNHDRQYTRRTMLIGDLPRSHEQWLLPGAGDRRHGITVSGMASLHRAGNSGCCSQPLALVPISDPSPVPNPCVFMPRCELYVRDLVGVLLSGKEQG